MDSKRRTEYRFVQSDQPDEAAIQDAAAFIRSGRLVAFPTETVYGLGADATNETAVRDIFWAKKRPYSDPLIVHVPSVDDVKLVAATVPPLVYTLAAHFWPGPLTVIVPRGPTISPVVAAGGETIGVRVPAHPVALALLRAANTPIAAPSANLFMHTSPTTAQHVLDDLQGRIDMVLDAGASQVGLESTVLDVTVDPPRILRPGGITLEALKEVIGVEPQVSSSSEKPSDQPQSAPGMLERHYAPRARFIVFDGHGTSALAGLRLAAWDALTRGERVGALLADDEVHFFRDIPVTVATMGRSDDVEALSRRLYAALREIDDGHVDVIFSHTFGTRGLAFTLRDRLRRAAGGSFQPVEP